MADNAQPTPGHCWAHLQFSLQGRSLQLDPQKASLRLSGLNSLNISGQAIYLKTNFSQTRSNWSYDFSVEYDLYNSWSSEMILSAYFTLPLMTKAKLASYLFVYRHTWCSGLGSVLAEVETKVTALQRLAQHLTQSYTLHPSSHLFIVWWRSCNCLSQSKYRTWLKLKTGPGCVKQATSPPPLCTHLPATLTQYTSQCLWASSRERKYVQNGRNRGPDMKWRKHDIFTAITCKTLNMEHESRSTKDLNAFLLKWKTNYLTFCER